MSKTKEKKKLADLVNLESVRYERQTRGRQNDRAVVTFAKSTKTLYFNPKMMKLLNISKWDQVIVGFDKKTNIILLRCCDATEYGAVALLLPPPAGETMKSKESYNERRKKCRLIRITHILQHFNGDMPKVFHAEREGEIVFLRSIDMMLNDNEADD